VTSFEHDKYARHHIKHWTRATYFMYSSMLRFSGEHPAGRGV